MENNSLTHKKTVGVNSTTPDFYQHDVYLLAGINKVMEDSTTFIGRSKFELDQDGMIHHTLNISSISENGVVDIHIEDDSQENNRIYIITQFSNGESVGAYDIEAPEGYFELLDNLRDYILTESEVA